MSSAVETLVDEKEAERGTPLVTVRDPLIQNNEVMNVAATESFALPQDDQDPFTS